MSRREPRGSLHRAKLPAWWQRLRLRSRPVGLTRTQRRNFLYTQMDALGVGLVMAVNPFVSVFLARLGATNQQVGLLSAIPGIAGLVLGLLAAGFLQRQGHIVRWYSVARFVRLIVYAGVGLAAMLLPAEAAIFAILAVILLSSIPQALITVAFSVVMNAVAGPNHRFALLSRRWSTVAVVGVVMTLAVGQLLDRVPFPLNYEIAFISLAVAGAIISFSFSRRIRVPDNVTGGPARSDRQARGAILDTARAVWAQKPYVSIVFKRLVYLMGSNLVIPLFSLYWVRDLAATDAEISWITTAQRIALLAGYYAWPRLRSRRGTPFVLLASTLAMGLYPILTALTRRVEWMIVIAGVASVFQAGVNLVFFDKLMETVPDGQGTVYVAISQTLQNLEAIVGPLVSTWIADFIGIGGALIVGAALRLAGFGLFLVDSRGDREARGPEPAQQVAAAH